MKLPLINIFQHPFITFHTFERFLISKYNGYNFITIQSDKDIEIRTHISTIYRATRHDDYIIPNASNTLEILPWN
jgi:hypothetical protein